MTTTTTKLDLRTCPFPDLCEWVAANIMEWQPYPEPSCSLRWMTKDGERIFESDGMTDFSSLDAVAAVERKAREGRLGKKWGLWTQYYPLQKLHEAAWGIGTNYDHSIICESLSEPEARLRAVALAWEAAKEEA
jgi:hypothetical protein